MKVNLLFKQLIGSFLIVEAIRIAVLGQSEIDLILLTVMRLF